MGSILEAAYRFSRNSQSCRESLMEYLRKTKVMLGAMAASLHRCVKSLYV